MKEKAIQAAWEGPSQCQHCGIRQLVLFADLQHDDLRLVHEPIDELKLQMGDTLFRTGETGTSVYTVRSGLLKLVQYLPGREDMGAMLGVTTETVSRITAEPRREGLLRVFDNNRAAADVAALAVLASDT